MDEAAIDAAGLTPLQPTLDSIAAIRDRKDLARVLGSTLRADVDALNATNFYTDNLFGLWVAQDLDDPTHYSPFLLQGGLGMPDRELLRRRLAAMATIRAKYQAHIAAMLGLAKIADADAKAARDRRARDAGSPRRTASREESGDVDQGQQPLDAGRVRHQGAGPRLGGVLRRRRASASRRRSSSGSPSAVTGISALVASEPLDDLEGLPDLPRHRVARGRAARGLRRRGVRLLRHGAERRPEAARPLEARRSTPPTTRSATPSASSTSRRTSRPRRRRGPRRW